MDSVLSEEAEDEATCWDSCDQDTECTAAVYNGITCWHKTMDVTVSNVEYKRYSTRPLHAA
jgi:hypothetical protein